MYADTRKLLSEINLRLYRIDNELFGIPAAAHTELSRTFEFYANADVSNREFYNLLNKLRGITEKLNNQDAWGYSEIRGLFSPAATHPTMADLQWLINDCQIPEGQIHHRRQKYFDTGFDDIVLSRYGAYLMVRKMAQDNINSDDFTYEKLAFARAFFATTNNPDYGNLVSMSYDFIRGEKLKNDFKIATARIGGAIKKFNRSADWITLNNIMQKYIFDILFARAASPINKTSLCDIYNSVLPNTGIQTFIPFISPHIMILLIQSINNFCDKISQDIAKDPTITETQSLEKLALDFFMNIRYGIENLKRSDPKICEYFKDDALFNDYHHSKCSVSVKQIEHGIGRKKQDPFWNIEYRESEGISNYARNNNLFDADDIATLKDRKQIEQNLIAAYNQQPYDDVKVAKLKSEINELNCAIYGVNVPDFMAAAARNRPDAAHQLSIQFESKPWHSAEYNSTELIKMPDNKITIPGGKPVTREDFIGADGTPRKNWYFNDNGIYQAVNPLKKDIKEFRIINGKTIPTLIQENFQLCNFGIESDTMNLPEQKQLLRYLAARGIVNLGLFSGNKSIHMRITVADVPDTLQEYEWLFLHIGLTLGLIKREWNDADIKYNYTGDIDLSLRFPNAKLRRPNKTRIIEKTGATVLQELLYQSNNIWDINWRDAYANDMTNFKNLEEKAWQTIKTNSKAFYHFGNKNGPRLKPNAAYKSMAEIESAITSQWVPNNGTRHNLLETGIIRYMVIFGYTESEIRAKFPQPGDHKQTIDNFIKNAFRGKGTK